jgi:transposase
MAKPIPMHQIKRIIELLQEGRSIGEIKRLTGLSRNTIRHYIRRIQSIGISPIDLLALDDDALKLVIQTDAFEQGLSGRKVDTRFHTIEKNLDHYNGELHRLGVTRQLLWEEYRKEYPEGYGYSQFCLYLRQHNQKDQAVMRFIHKPGELLEVDYAGDKTGYVDVSTGEWIACDVLVCTMAYSNYMYVEALRCQKQEELASGMGNTFVYLGGVPSCVKFDNTKTVVARANRYEPKFTEAMDLLAAHYGTIILTARVRKPRDKPHVEKGVDLTYKRIYAPLRDKVFHSLTQLNVAFREQLDLFNAMSFKNKPGCRKQWFEADEKPLLKPLPSTRYEIKHVTESKVPRDYHVILGEDKHHYSVPFTLIGKHLKIVYTSLMVEIYQDLKRVATHARNYKKNGFTTIREHMPLNHQHMIEQRGWDGAHFEQQARMVGEATLGVISRVLKSKIFVQQTFNSCLGILRLGKKYGNERLEAACLRVADAPFVNYGVIDNILKCNLDKGSNTPTASPIPPHDQIRGADQYQ